MFSILPTVESKNQNSFFNHPFASVSKNSNDDPPIHPLDTPFTLDPQGFQIYLGHPDFRESFRAWLISNPHLHQDGLLKLDRWMDEMKVEPLVQSVREYSLSLFSKAIHNQASFLLDVATSFMGSSTGLYHVGKELPKAGTDPKVTQDTLSSLSRLAMLDSGLQSSRAALVASLYEGEFHVSDDSSDMAEDRTDYDRLSTSRSLEILRNVARYIEIHHIKSHGADQKSTETESDPYR